MSRLPQPQRRNFSARNDPTPPVGNLMDRAGEFLYVPAGWAPDRKTARMWAVYAQAWAHDVVELDMFCSMLGHAGGL